MCLIAVAAMAHPQWPVIVAANRDEFHKRPASAMAPWIEAPAVIGGRDLQAGGGWLAVRADGPYWAAVTNYRDPTLGAAPLSRGVILSAAIQSNGLPTRENLAQAGGMNLLQATPEGLSWARNQPDVAITRLPAGLHALSNGALGSAWPKQQRLATALTQAAAITQANALINHLLRALADRQPADDRALPHTGVGLAMERMLSPPFIAGEAYGTRASTVLLWDGAAWLATERRFGPNGAGLGTTRWRSDPTHQRWALAL